MWTHEPTGKPVGSHLLFFLACLIALAWPQYATPTEPVKVEIFQRSPLPDGPNNVILGEAKDPRSSSCTKGMHETAEILRFAQDDRIGFSLTFSGFELVQSVNTNRIFVQKFALIAFVGPGGEPLG